jgi:ankyrin repeat protein
MALANQLVGKTMNDELHLLYDAARHGNLAKVKALLKGNPGLVFSKDNEGTTPLHTAAANGHKDVAELLVANKAEVNAKDSHGFTPLHWAAYFGHRHVAELLRQRGGHE